MKKRLSILIVLACVAVLPLAAKDKWVSARIGAEAALENNFTAFGIGPYGDVNVSFGKYFDLEGYLGWTPYVLPPSYGTLYGEIDFYYHQYFKKRVTLHPALSVSDLMVIGGMNTVNIEPSIKLDVRDFFVKFCVPLQIMPEFVPFAYAEPGFHLKNWTFKARGTVQADPFEFNAFRWWIDYAFGKNDLYAYGVVKGFGAGERINYNQYVGMYLGF